MPVRIWALLPGCPDLFALHSEVLFQSQIVHLDAEALDELIKATYERLRKHR